MFRFTIRDAVWLTVVVVLEVCWWAAHQGLRAVNAALGRQWLDHIRDVHPGEAAKYLRD